MGNMSYCRFGNTAKDLQDCVNNWELEENLEEDEEPSEYEVRGKQQIIDLAKEIVEMEGYEVVEN